MRLLDVLLLVPLAGFLICVLLPSPRRENPASSG